MVLSDRLVDVTRAAWRRVRPEIAEHIERLWAEPELPLMETRAAEALAAWMERHGFDVERGACGIPTAFAARFGRRAGPTIALIAEYDALPGQGNRAMPHRAPDGQLAGHACGHNQIGPAQAGAAIAAAVAMETSGLGGRLVVVGCPAEELLWGKLALLDRGAFAGADALLTSHADYQNGALSRPCLACVSSELVFTGVASHGGAARHHNALHALELVTRAIEDRRSARLDGFVVGHVVRAGGLMPAITPAETRLWVTVRHESFEAARDAWDEIAGLAVEAARTAGVSVREQLIAASRGYLPNDVLARVLDENLRRVGPPAWTADDVAWMEALSRACDPAAPFALDRGLRLHTEGCDPYGQDDGEASWRIPLGRVNWAIPRAVPLHHWGTTALSGHAAGLPGPLMASEALALTVVELLAEPVLIAEARRELAGRVGSRPVSAPEYGDFATMTRAPEAFWGATWRVDEPVGGSGASAAAARPGCPRAL
jgi:aminobenzoyl-glutamate utilization protein B